MLLTLLLSCTDPKPPEPAPAQATPQPTGDTGAPTPPTDTDDEEVPFDCDTVPPGPWSATPLVGIPASEDFAFDGDTLISVSGDFLVRSLHPPGETVPWVGTQGGQYGPASLRMLPNGDLVYHDVNTATLYRVEPDGGVHVVVSSFVYGGGMEVHPNGLVYVVDIAGLHFIEPFEQSDVLMYQAAPWMSANGITLSADHTLLFLSSRNGIWAISVDPDGTPAGEPTLWADKPPDVSEMLGMGADLCGNLYVVTSSFVTGSGVWRYPANGGTPEPLLETQAAWYSNLQWGSGEGGWDGHTLYVTDQYSGDVYQTIPVGVPEKSRTSR